MPRMRPSTAFGRRDRPSPKKQPGQRQGDDGQLADRIRGLLGQRRPIPQGHEIKPCHQRREHGPGQRGPDRGTRGICDSDRCIIKTRAGESPEYNTPGVRKQIPGKFGLSFYSLSWDNGQDMLPFDCEPNPPR